jgi:hypothetical protein
MLTLWLTESESVLKNFTPKSSLEEKIEQLDKFKVSCCVLIIFFS